MRRFVAALVLGFGVVAAGCPASDDDTGNDTNGGGTDATSDGADVTTTTSTSTSTLPDSIEFETNEETTAGDDATTPSDGLQDTGAPAGTDCDSGGECASGWCVPSAIGSVCVDLCVTDCPDDHVCVQADGAGSDPVFLCVPLTRPPGPDTTDDTTVVPDTTLPDATIDNDVIGPDVPLEDVPVDDTVMPDTTVEPDTSEPDSIISDNDQDDDGIPDDEDNIPCLGFYLTVYNDGVTSGSLALNGTEVVSPDSFPTEAPIIVTLNPVQGTNTLAITGKLTGSPSDSLTLVVQDSTGRLWFYVVIVRQPGSPQQQSYTFEIDVDCDALEP